MIMSGYGNYEAFTNYDFANGNIGTGNSKTLDNLSSQWNDYVNSVNNNNFAGTLPKFNYNPETGDTDVTNKNETYRQKNKEDLLFNESLDQRDALFKQDVNSAVDLQTRMRNAQDYQQKILMDNQKAVAEKELNRPRTQSFSYSSTLDPASAEGQKYQAYQVQDANNKAYTQSRLNDAEIGKQQQLIPMQTQATIQTQAPQFQSQQKVADIQAEAQKAVALAAQQAQMYGANLNAMSSMFGSQMGAVGSMFGGIGGGGGAKYW
jgi:hypothetical protein